MMVKLLPKFGKRHLLLSVQIASSPEVQDDHVCGPRDYLKNGQLFRTFHPVIHLNRSRS